MIEQQTLDGDTIPVPEGRLDYETLSYGIHEYDVMWANAAYEEQFAIAVEQAKDALPKHVTDEEATGLVRAVFDPLYDAATDDGFSLWMTIHDSDGEPQMEVPVFQRSPVGAWCSPNPGVGSAGDAEPSDAFFTAVAHLFEETDTAWGGVAEATWDALSRPEKELVESLKDMALQCRLTPEAVTLHDYARWYVDDE